MLVHRVRSRATCAICCGLDDQASNWLVFTWPCPSSRFRQNTLASFFSLLRSSLALALHYNQHSLVSREVEKVESKFNSKSTVLPCCTLHIQLDPQILHWLNRAKLDRFRAQLRCDRVSYNSTVASAVPGRTTGKTGKWGSANIL